MPLKIPPEMFSGCITGIHPKKILHEFPRILALLLSYIQAGITSEIPVGVHTQIPSGLPLDIPPCIFPEISPAFPLGIT